MQRAWHGVRDLPDVQGVRQVTGPEFPLDGDRVCGDCGRDNPAWFTDSPLWNRVMGGPGATDDPGGVVCPTDFARRAEAAGVTGVWKLELTT